MRFRRAEEALALMIASLSLCFQAGLCLPIRCSPTVAARGFSGGISASPSALLSSASPTDFSVRSVGIVGGGLAGLSTAYHLLQKCPSIDITIFDKADPGFGGASSVAGGLLHPLSPRGKLVHLGLEGLSCTNELIDAALRHDESAILRNEILRLAVSDAHVSTLKQTAADYPSFTQWLTIEDLDSPELHVQGALRLHSGCKVVHVPTYLRGLWKACQFTGSGTKQWIKETNLSSNTICEKRMSDFDAIVLSAGAGLFQNSISSGLDELPVQLVRGQSIELKMPHASDQAALLCGKYISPLPDDRRILIGATHEFKAEALSPENVEFEMKEKTLAFASDLWAAGTVDTITTGFRVQSERGTYGRLPIVGSFDSSLHRNAWIFTGLSSRGLLYHGLFGDIVTDLILREGDTEDESPEICWWKKLIAKRNKKT